MRFFGPLGPLSGGPALGPGLVARWHGVLQAVRGQQWTVAREALELLERDDPGRLLYALYQERLDDWQANPPGPDWDGAQTFTSK